MPKHSSRAKGKPVSRPVHTNGKLTLQPGEVAPVAIHSMAIPALRSCVFEPEQLPHVNLLSHAVDSKTQHVLMRNATKSSLEIPPNMRLGWIEELQNEDLDQVHPQDAERAADTLFPCSEYYSLSES